MNEKLTIGDVKKILKDRQYKDIFDTFKKLKNGKLIKKQDKVKHGRGQPSNYFNITELGLELLINDNIENPLNFWKIIIGYCHHRNKEVDEIKIQGLIESFKKKYMKYKFKGYYNQLDVLNKVMKKWMKNYLENKNGISNEQKILEVISLKRGVTSKQLIDEIKISNIELNRILSLYTLQNYEPPHIQKTFSLDATCDNLSKNKSQLVNAVQSIYVETTDTMSSIIENFNLQRDFTPYLSPGIAFPIPSELRVEAPLVTTKYLKTINEDFLLHCFVQYRYDETKDEYIYELSLYGVIAVLFLIRHSDMGDLKHGLFFKDISFPDFYDKVVNNYKNKLPLVFEKWPILKEVLRLFAIYNFDIILDKKVRQNQLKSDSGSVTRGGNMELISGINVIISHNRNQLAFFAHAGEAILNNYLFNMGQGYYNITSNNIKGNRYLSQNNINKGESLDETKVEIIRNFLDKELFAIYPLEYAFDRYHIMKNHIDRKLLLKYLYENVVKVREEMLQWEVTSLYFFNLYFDIESDLRFSHPMRYYSAFEDRKTIYPIYEKPKDCLNHVFAMDKQQPFIKTWFLDIMSDLYMLKSEIERSLLHFIEDRLY